MIVSRLLPSARFIVRGNEMPRILAVDYAAGVLQSPKPSQVGRFALKAPPELAGIILSFAWDRTRLHALDLPVEELAVVELNWQLDLRWWKFDGCHFAVTPNEVRVDPVRYQHQWLRTGTADLAYPIHVTETAPGRWTILDGVHRLLKADAAGEQTIRAMRVRDLDPIRIVQ